MVRGSFPVLVISVAYDHRGGSFCHSKTPCVLLLMLVGGGRLFMQLGVTGLSNLLWGMFAMGLLLLAREPVRELSEESEGFEYRFCPLRN